jgi:hypothetical protein
MAVVKVSMKEFLERLPSYDNTGAARKAIGRFNGWSEEEKNRARALVDKHFGEEPKKYARPAHKQAKRAAAKAPAAPAKRRGRPPKSARAPELTSVSDNSAITDMAALSVMSSPVELGKAPVRFSAERIIQCAGSAIKTLEMVHAIDPSVCLTSHLEQVANNVTNAICLLGEHVPMSISKDSVSVRAPVRRGRPPKAAAPVQLHEQHPRTNGSAALDMSAIEDDQAEISEV